MEAKTTYDRVLGELRTAILDGSHAPGSRLMELDLVKRYGASRIPVREALRRLEAEGLVRTAPNRGATVRGIDPKDLDELADVRVALEGLAARTAAAVCADVLPATRSLAATARDAAGARDLDALISADQAFHALIASASGNRHIVETMATRWPIVARAMRLHLSLEGYPLSVWDEHEAIARAVAAGDVERASTLMIAHIENARRVVLAVMDSGPRA